MAISVDWTREPSLAPDSHLRGLLEHQLDRLGYGRLPTRLGPAGEPARGALRRAMRMTVYGFAVALWVLMSLGFAAAQLLGAAWWAYVIASLLAIFLALGIVGARIPDSLSSWHDVDDLIERVAVLVVPFFATAILIAGAEVALAGPDLAVTTHALPAGIVLGLVAVWGLTAASASAREVRRQRLERRRGVVGRAIWLAVPIALVALLLQLFTTELWLVADQLEVWQAGLLAGLTVIPLVAVLYWQLRRAVPDAFETVAERMVRPDQGRLPGRLLELLAPLDPVQGRTGGKVDDDVRKLLLVAYDPSTVVARAQAIARVLKGSFDFPLAVSLVPLVVLIAVIMSAFIYVLAWITLDVGLVGDWLDSSPDATPTPAPTKTWDLLVADVTLPVGPYLVISLMLGVVATAIFLASMLAQAEYRAPLTDGVIHRPVETCLLYALPFAYLMVKHDRRVAAQALDADSEGSRDDDNTFATHDESDDLEATGGGGRSLWYRWTAPATECYSFGVESFAFDPVLAVYPAGTSEVLALGRSRRPAWFPASKGQTYEISVDGAAGEGDEHGPFQLTWQRQPAADNDAFADAEQIQGLAGSTAGANLYATREEGEPEHPHATGGRSVWYRWRAPADEWVTFAVAGDRPGYVLAVYEGTALGNLQLVEHGQPTVPGTACSVRFEAAKGTVYRLVVDAVDDGGGPFQLEWLPASVPANDAFANPERLPPATSGEVRGRTTYASSEEGEPQHAGQTGGKSIWFAWTPAESAWVTFDTHGSDFDTLLAVYLGTELPGLEEVASNDDAFATTKSEVKFGAEAGREYRIALDGYAGASGSVVLRWQEAPPPPAHDMFEAARRLEGLQGTVEDSNELATAEPGEPRHAAFGGGKSLWYRWEPDRDAWMCFTTRGSDFDTVLAVYTGPTLDQLTPVAANDCASGTEITSRVRFHAEAGTTYHVAVDGHRGTGGRVVLGWSELPLLSSLGLRLRGSVVKPPGHPGSPLGTQ